MSVCLDWDVINIKSEAWKAPSGLFSFVRKECYMQSANKPRGVTFHKVKKLHSKNALCIHPPPDPHT